MIFFEKLLRWLLIEKWIEMTCIEFGKSIFFFFF
jgi:hypothetical protein